MEEAFVHQAGFGWHPLYMWGDHGIYIFIYLFIIFKLKFLFFRVSLVPRMLISLLYILGVPTYPPLTPSPPLL
jgi:hypothetical protein